MIFSILQCLHLAYLPRGKLTVSGVPTLAYEEWKKRFVLGFTDKLHHAAGCRTGIPASTETDLVLGKQEKGQNCFVTWCSHIVELPA